MYFRPVVCSLHEVDYDGNRIERPLCHQFSSSIDHVYGVCLNDHLSTQARGGQKFRNGALSFRVEVYFGLLHEHGTDGRVDAGGENWNDLGRTVADLHNVGLDARSGIGDLDRAVGWRDHLAPNGNTNI